MKLIYDFMCSDSKELHERYVERYTDTDTCKCGATMNRVISPIRCSLDHTFPGESMKWAKQHEQGAKQGLGKG